MVASPFSVDFAVLVLTATGLGALLRRAGLPTIIAYIATGFVLGPAVLGVVQESALIGLFSELGLAFLLFFLGIEIDVGKLGEMFGSVLRITAWQRFLQVTLAFGLYLALGFAAASAIVMAVATVFGATPVIVKLLSDQGELETTPGRIDTGVLVVQDVYVVLLLAFLAAEAGSNWWLLALSAGEILVFISVLAGVAYAASRRLLPRVFDTVVGDKHAFFVHGLAFAFILISLSEVVGLPVEIGAFFAGLALGGLPGQGELRERVRPLTLLFMVVFFSSIGLGVSWQNLTAYWWQGLAAGSVLMVGNASIMYWAIRRQGFDDTTSFLASLNMTQASEFTLVAGSAAVTYGYISGAELGFLSIMALYTMTVSAALITYNDKLVRLAGEWLDPAIHSRRRRSDHTVLVGCDDAALDLLDVIDGEVCVVDNNASHRDDVERRGAEFIFGDFFHEEMRDSVDLDEARLVVSVIPSLAVSKHILRDTDGATVIVKANDGDEAAELYGLGADYVIVKDSALTSRVVVAVDAWLHGGLAGLREQDGVAV